MSPFLVRAWHRTSFRTLFEHRLFRLDREQLASTDGGEREALVLRAPDWVNVIALFPDDRVLLVRQWRYGVEAETLEIPGGMIDAGETPLDAARRELMEETGHTATQWIELGQVEPNPAFLSNVCTTFLARGLVEHGDPAGDGEEELTVATVPLAEIPDHVRRGEIRHALVLCAFHLLGLRDDRALAPEANT